MHFRKILLITKGETKWKYREIETRKLFRRDGWTRTEKSKIGEQIGKKDSKMILVIKIDTYLVICNL